MARALQTIVLVCALAVVPTVAFSIMGTPYPVSFVVAAQVALGLVCFMLGRATRVTRDAHG